MAAARPNAATSAVAHLRFVRMGPRKLRRVADAIRGKSVREALVLLKFADVFAAEPIEKLVKVGRRQRRQQSRYERRRAVHHAHHRRRRPGRTFHQAPGSARARPRVLQAQASLARDGRRERNAAEASRAAPGRLGRAVDRASRRTPPRRPSRPLAQEESRATGSKADRAAAGSSE